MKNYWVGCYVACGAGDSCQTIQLRKVEDIYWYGNTERRTDTYCMSIYLSCHILYDGMMMWSSSSGYAEHGAAAGTVEGFGLGR